MPCSMRVLYMVFSKEDLNSMPWKSVFLAFLIFLFSICEWLQQFLSLLCVCKLIEEWKMDISSANYRKNTIRIQLVDTFLFLVFVHHIGHKLYKQGIVGIHGGFLKEVKDFKSLVKCNVILSCKPSDKWLVVFWIWLRFVFKGYNNVIPDELSQGILGDKHINLARCWAIGSAGGH